VLGYAEYGDLSGKPIFYFHGFPGSRFEAQATEIGAARHGLRIIAVERPGFGLSDFLPDRFLSDWPSDVIELADALGIKQFAVLGVSGGGPYALACAAKIPQRLTAVSVVGSLAPPDVEGITEGMTCFSRRVLFLSSWMPWGVRFIYSSMLRTIQQNPDRFLTRLTKMTSAADQMTLSRGEVRQVLITSFREAGRNGIEGGLRELYLYTHPWGFRLESISLPVHLLHGEQDRMVPPRMGHYLSKVLPNCQTTFYPDEGHYSLPVNHMTEILARLSD
jgi:pimeloyl-ACP methyl ester carboxylesterase